MKKSYYKFIVLFVIILIIWKIYYFVDYSDDKYANTLLYPKIKPFVTDYIKVSDIHTLGYSIYGNKNGKPILLESGLKIRKNPETNKL
mgnify:CR=1 FL=1